MYHLYILFSETANKYYIGYTADNLAERLRKHNTNHKGFTGGIGDWKIVYTEMYTDKNIATKREREVKKWKSRKMLEKLISKAKLSWIRSSRLFSREGHRFDLPTNLSVQACNIIIC